MPRPYAMPLPGAIDVTCTGLHCGARPGSPCRGKRDGPTCSARAARAQRYRTASKAFAAVEALGLSRDERAILLDMLEHRNSSRPDRPYRLP